MCLIIDNPQGQQIDPALIATAAKGNPDGWGIMTARAGRIRVTRGMDSTGLADAITAHEGTPHTIHFRYATHGKTDLKNCHPFVVLNRRYAVMHNGVLAIPQHDEDRSDTWHFCQHVLGPMLKAQPESFGGEFMTRMLASLIGGGNKLVVLRADGASMIVNREAGMDHDGLWLSNGHSLPAPTALKTWGWTWDEDPADASPQETEIRDYGFWPDRLADLAEVPFRDLAEFAQDYPESLAELIRDHFD